MKFKVILAIIPLCYGLDPGVRSKFSVGLDLGTGYFYDIPSNITEAEDQSWTASARPDGPMSSLVMYCPSDKHMCGLYDDTGYIAGLQISVEQENFTDIVYDMAVQGFKNWTVDNKTYYAMEQFFVDEAFLATKAEDRIAARNSSRTLQTNSIWVTAFSGELMELAVNETELATQNFVKQACIPWMGYHYYYNLTDDFVCSSSTLLPWFPLVYNGELIGTIFATYGVLPVVENERNWFERSPRLVVQATVPDAPDCHMDLVDDPGMLSMHIWYINDPWSIYCILGLG